MDEYQVTCTDKDSKTYVKKVVSDTVVQDDPRNLCTLFGIGNKFLEFNPANFDVSHEGAYSFMIRGYKTGQEDNYDEIEWTVNIKIDCETDTINVLNETSDIEFTIRPPLTSEF